MDGDGEDGLVVVIRISRRVFVVGCVLRVKAEDC